MVARMVLKVTVQNRHTEEIIPDELYVESIPGSVEDRKKLAEEIVAEEWGTDWKLLEVTT
jgi:fibronectin type 3 domain-containing protein